MFLNESVIIIVKMATASIIKILVKQPFLLAFLTRAELMGLILSIYETTNKIQYIYFISKNITLQPLPTCPIWTPN